MTEAKIAALDAEDLAILSAQVQDAVLTVADIAWQKSAGRVVIAMNRFVRGKRGLFGTPDERRRAVLQIDKVSAFRSIGIAKRQAEEVLAIMALRFVPSELPAGSIEIVLAGGGMLKAEAECIEVRLTDLGPRWQASSRPAHGV